MWNRYKSQIFNLFNGRIESPREKSFHTFMLILIVLNVAAVMLETVSSIHAAYLGELFVFEVFSVTVFTVEYILRIWTCVLSPSYQHPFWGRLKFVFSPMALIDLISILPFYLPLLFSFDLRFIRILRLFRMFRIFKLGRYSDAYRLIARVFINKMEYLAISLVFVASLLIIAASLMYFAEHAAQPEVFSSIPSAMWWAIITLTTVGYGDIYPVTFAGKILSGVLAILGIGLFALPAGLLATGFSEELNKRNACSTTCPHCGKPISK